jgi:hypothetical protein
VATTTFILMLPLDASASAFEGFISVLDASFHQHELLAGEPGVGGFENTVLAVQVLIAIGRQKARFPAAGLGLTSKYSQARFTGPNGSKPIDGEYTGHTNADPERQYSTQRNRATSSSQVFKSTPCPCARPASVSSGIPLQSI